MTEEPIIWTTNTRRSKALSATLASATGFQVRSVDDFPWKAPVPSIVYGILRGCSEIIRICQTAKVSVWHIDHGYFGRGDLDLQDGYYRISKNELYARMPKRWMPNGYEKTRFYTMKREPVNKNLVGDSILICPPTLPIAAHYGVNPLKWTLSMIHRYVGRAGCIVREKGDPMPQAEAFAKSSLVVTYNSNIAIEAMMAGLPATQEKGPLGVIGHRYGEMPIWLANNQWKLSEVTREVFGCAT